MSTSYSTRTPPTTSYTGRPWVNFLMTQDLDFLMTQDWNYIVLQDSLVSNYTWRTPVTTSYSLRPAI